MNENATRYTSPEFAEKFAPLPDDYFILNRETGKIELHFDKSTYGALTDAQKGKIKSSFLWGRNSGCWISRCKWPNTGYAARVAEDIWPPSRRVCSMLSASPLKTPRKFVLRRLFPKSSPSSTSHSFSNASPPFLLTPH